MEVIPVLMLWLCMPLDTGFNFPSPDEGEIGMFPSAEYVQQELREARHRRSYAWKQYYQFCGKEQEGVREERFWNRVYTETQHVVCVLEQLDHAHKAVNRRDYCQKNLTNVRNQIGSFNYYHGQIPSQVFVPGIPPKKAGDR